MVCWIECRKIVEGEGEEREMVGLYVIDTLGWTP